MQINPNNNSEYFLMWTKYFKELYSILSLAVIQNSVILIFYLFLKTYLVKIIRNI
jgi:hypothetical protein